MRKVLLATTALVAMGGVSAASADISISGAAQYNYTTTSGTGGTDAEDRTMATNVDADLTMSSTLDNGMSLSGLVSLNTNAVNDSGWSLSGDFGKVAFGGTANDGFGATTVSYTHLTLPTILLV